ncbi:MAG: rod shape-determining protein [Tissierellia bacterium]|nr:rod shape-determining protein [Tissierellia bacterium]
MKGFKIYANDLGIDLGTDQTLIADRHGKIIIDEPSIVALDINTYEVLAVGREAKNMIGKTPANIVAVSPIENGVIADFEITLAMLSYFLQKAVGGYSLFQPKVTVTCPLALTDVERRSVEDVCLHAGARDAHLIEENIASALGADLEIMAPKGHLLCNIGAGRLETSIVSLGGIITGQSLPIGGEYIDRQIQEIIKRQHNLLLGKDSCERIKKELATLDPKKLSRKMDVTGRNLVKGMPEIIEVHGEEIREPILQLAEDAVKSIRKVLEMIPPEISKDILEEGILFVGGVSQLDGLKEYIQERIKLPVQDFEDPLTITGRGIGLRVNIKKSGR